MENKKRVCLAMLIMVALIIIRIYLEFITKNTDITNKVLSSINVIALVFVIINIYIKAYKKMEKVHNKIGKQRNGHHIKANKHMIKFKKRFNIVIVILIFIGAIYIIFIGNTFMNDILTTIALVLSIEDEGFVYILAKKNYNYF
ncbi:hypothetical protein [Tepidibacter sp. Z1-5]|uniref:hypothetical protein n=1 Tax=Tepidibacter sp. Z1-5 TaxID=3134138 RepID=UPI0030BAC196